MIENSQDFLIILKNSLEFAINSWEINTESIPAIINPSRIWIQSVKTSTNIDCKISNCFTNMCLTDNIYAYWQYGWDHLSTEMLPRTSLIFSSMMCVIHLPKDNLNKSQEMLMNELYGNCPHFHHCARYFIRLYAYTFWIQSVH